MIVAGGCSFTSSDFKSTEGLDVSFKKWPEIIAAQFEVPLVNFAKCGYGNDYIVDKLVPFILENHEDISLVVVGWTEMTRFHLYYQHHFNPQSFFYGEDGDPYSSAYKFFSYPYSTAQTLLKETHMDNIAMKMYDEFKTLTLLCQRLNLKFVFGQILRPINSNVLHYDWSYVPDKFDMNNWIRHPVYQSPIFDFLKKEHWLSETDPHPNKEGHKLIADFYLNKYRQLYS